MAASLAAAPIHRLALLVGIDDYSGSGLARSGNGAPAPGRDFPTLHGSVTDANAMRELLAGVYGFDRRDIVTLLNGQATRAAIVQALQTLADGAAKDDVLFFYFAGHGSQVRNSASDEPDKLDETIVPADSRRGAPDIRDKELRRIFNRMLDRGVRLTILLDSCHSGSGARGLPSGAPQRSVTADLRDVHDGANYGPRPEDRGAVVLSAAQDYETALETRDLDGNFHGVFSWAWMRALRDAPANESVLETFLRAQARMRAETPYQVPVIAGSGDVRALPFLGSRSDRRADRTIVAIEKVKSDGTIVLQGGWANGLAVGSTLRLADHSTSQQQLVITSMIGLARSEARVQTSALRDTNAQHAHVRNDVRIANAENVRQQPAGLVSGALLEVVGWSTVTQRPFVVWMPQLSASASEIRDLARTFARVAASHHLRWIGDPTEVTPDYVLRRSSVGWELLGATSRTIALRDDAAAAAALARLPRGASLFVQLPAPATLVSRFNIGPHSAHESIEQTNDPATADYLLTGRYERGRLSYAWVRPSMRRIDADESVLPVRSDWFAPGANDYDLGNARDVVRAALFRLYKVRAWQLLESPPGVRPAYALALRHQRDSQIVQDGHVVGGERYGLLLRAEYSATTVASRFVYVFVVDSFGRSILVFPRSGSVENRFPLQRDPGTRYVASPPREIALGEAASLQVEPPYGVDTYVLLSTDEALPNPWILEWDGVRTRDVSGASPLERLLAETGAGTRSVRVVTPANWSIQRVVWRSVAPHHDASRREARR
jgi:hypothetical protein